MPFANQQRDLIGNDTGQMRRQYQAGCIRRAKRKTRIDVWEYLWREQIDDGRCIRHTQVIGSVDQYPTKELASNAVNGLRARVNEKSFRLRLRPVFVGDLVDHFLQTAFDDQSDLYAASTKVVMPDTINRWIRPRWECVNIRDVRTVAVKQWLMSLSRKDGKPLANSTKAKVRNLMRRLFNHAITYEWLKQGENPIKHVRQSAKRQKEPEPFEPDEVQRLLDQLKSPYREMVLVLLSFGLRRSELFALQWRDFNFERNEVTIVRNICYGKLGQCKTQASHATLPMLPLVAIALCVWRKLTPHNQPEDWVFPSTHTKGRKPLHPGGPMNDVIKPEAIRAGISKRVHWHAFRYTFGTWLVANGVDIAVVHELMRHASPRTTLEFYIKARKRLKLGAQEQIQTMLFPGDKQITLTEDLELIADVKKQQKRSALRDLESTIFGGEDSYDQPERDETQMDDDKQDRLM